MKPFFLVDCNNFFVSCERVFNPALRNKPVVVLSSNDACVIARSAEAKKLGIPMGAAAWEYEQFFKRHNVIVHSANFALYGDMSTRVMRTLTEFCADIEIYSVDEAFLYAPANITSIPTFARFLKNTVEQRTGIPISIGIGPTKTMAKLANYLAKKRSEYAGIAHFEEHQDDDALLATIPVEEVWGIGYRFNKKLHNRGIKTVRDFKYCSDSWVRKNMTVVGLKTLQEIRRLTCIPLHTSLQAKQSITVSRLFGTKTHNLRFLQEALASYVTTAAQKLRMQQSLTRHISVFATIARYHDHELYTQSIGMQLPLPTAYTPTLIQAAHTCLARLYIPGLLYKKVGVIMTDFVPGDGVQLSTYITQPAIQEQTTLMNTIDRINAKMGKNTVFFTAAGIQRPWTMKQMKKSACYTTNWHELLTIHL